MLVEVRTYYFYFFIAASAVERFCRKISLMVDDIEAFFDVFYRVLWAAVGSSKMTESSKLIENRLWLSVWYLNTSNL